MSELAKKLAKEVSLLPREDRVELIEELLQSLNTPGLAEIDKLWEEEAEKRINEYENGSVEALDGKQVFKEIREQFKN
jgi:putative addiction module component (TIGR02574 family)